MADGPINNNPTTPPDFLLRAVSRILRPLVRMLIAYGVTFPMLAELLKRLYVTVAAGELSNEGSVSDSRISLATRVHRKDVKRLREEGGDMPLPPTMATLGAQIVGHWLAAPEYTGKDGTPLVLPRQARAGQPSFDMMVTSLSKDVRPRAVLDELLHQEVVSMTADKQVKLNLRAFIPRRDFEDMAYYFGRNLHDHIAAGSHNLTGDGPALLERSVCYNGLTPASVDKLARISEEIGMAALVEINRQAHELSQQDKDRKDATERMNFGLYFYQEDQGEPQDE